MKCRCNEITYLEGNEASEYADEHLQEVSARNWEIDYVCPETGRRWLMDAPQSELHGGGPARLRSLPLKAEKQEQKRGRESLLTPEPQTKPKNGTGRTNQE